VGGIDVVRNPVQARRLLAVIPQRNNLDRSLSIRNNLIFHAAYHGVGASDRGRRADELLNQFGLLERARSKPDFFSGGQAQRVMIARALMHAPRVLFLDEPTTGLDPAARLFVWDRLRELRQGGVTLLLTTHDMEEAAALADRVGIMDRGKLLALDTPAALTRSLPGQSTLELTTGTAPAAEHDLLMKDLAALHGVERVEEVPVASSNGGAPTGPWSGAGSSSAAETAPGSAGGGPAPLRVRLYLSVDAPSLVAPAAGVLTGHHLVLADVRIGAPSLEDVFIHLTGRTLR
jgi:ABC-2 type transport system ATP-binding protein